MVDLTYTDPRSGFARTTFDQGDGTYEPGVAALQPADVFDVVLSVDTSIYADGDVLADMQEVLNFVGRNGGRAMIQSVTLLDKADQGVALDLFVSALPNSLGTENSGPSITDANAVGLQNLRALSKTYSIETGDYKDLGGCRVATVAGIGLMVEAAAASRSIYIGAITRGGTPTYGAADLVLRLGVIWF